MPSSRPASPKRSTDVLDLLSAPRRAPLVMGIVNATPDSFYAQSRFPDPAAAVDKALALYAEGADLIDVGGQSTRPGSDPVPEAEEIRRVLPLVEALSARVKAPLSIDTDKAEVARLALEAGAAIVNDVSALRNDPRMTGVALKAQAVILMHRGGENSKTMQQAPAYRDVVQDVRRFLSERLDAFVRAGGDARRVLLDPGIGFGKNQEHNLSLLKRLDVLTELGPVALGVSRKSFLGRAAAEKGGRPAEPSERLEGSLAVACWAQLAGVKILRVHDVKETRRVLQTLAAVLSAH